jgi:hypothetical protein
LPNHFPFLVGCRSAVRHAATDHRAAAPRDRPRLRKVAAREAFLQQAAVAVTSTPEEMTRHLESEIGIWREVITRAKITVQ